jgi:cytochrome c oxidase subunit 2
MANNRKHLIRVSLLVVVGAVITYLILTAIYQLPVAASEQAIAIDQLFNVHFILISLLFALIVVFIGYSVVVFRRKEGDDEDGIHFEGNTVLEVLWTIIPLIIVVGLGIWAAFILSDITAAKSNEMVVEVTGRQWSWVFAYPDYQDAGSSDTLVLPVDQPVHLQMTAQDVLHSFWVPEFRMKQDLVPGQVTELRFTPTEIGEYKVLCAEICGLQHAEMRANVQVVSRADFDAWIAGRSTSVATVPPEERGARWATDFGCLGCHTVDGAASVGPTWQGLFGRRETMADGTTVTVDEAYMTESILQPAAHIVAGFPSVMPSTFEEQFAAKEAELQSSAGADIDIVADLIAYIKTLE